MIQKEDRTGCNQAAEPRPSLSQICAPDDSLRYASLQLPLADQWLLRQLFWNSVSQDQVARKLKITQQALSKRKRKVIRKLRQLLRGARTAMLLSGTLFGNGIAQRLRSAMTG